MTYYLGFDGGGTKTLAAIIDSDGRVVGEGTAGPSNPLRIGYVTTFSALSESATRALAAASLDKKQLRAVCAALAGAGRPGVADEVSNDLVSSFPGTLAYVRSDFEAALEAAVGPAAGVVLIAGTGAAAFGRNDAGRSARASGNGPWISDEGSAFDIGRNAMTAAARALDRGEPLGPLLERIATPSRPTHWNELIEQIAAQPDQVFPKFFPVVVEMAEGGDPLAVSLLQRAAADLSETAATVVRRLELQDREFVLAKSGGVFERTRVLDAEVDARLARVAPKARIEVLRTPPAVGAALIAKRFAEQAGQK
jgi:N-acetylglucosamine kinase-like BadF-type ATPase